MFQKAIIICVVAAVAVGIFIFIKNMNPQDDVSNSSGSTELSINKSNFLFKQSSHKMTVTFDSLPALTKTEESRLVEVKNEKILARIDSAVPGTLQAIANTAAVKEYSEAAKAAGQLYQAIIPKGAVLDKSRAMEGAFRGSYREVANSIKGQANWVAVDNGVANKLAAMNVANGAMGAAAMVVGQYYMTQIND